MGLDSECWQMPKLRRGTNEEQINEKEKAHEENNRKYVWFHSGAHVVTDLKPCISQLYFSQWSFICPTFGNITAKLIPEEKQGWGPDSDAQTEMPLACQMLLGIIPVLQQLENVELISALCHVLQSLPHIPALCILFGIEGHQDLQAGLSHQHRQEG